MAWNEPGGNNDGNKKDPWGGGNRNNNNDGPPDLDEVLRKLQDKVSSFLGGKKKSSSNGGGGGVGPAFGGVIVLVVLAVIAILYVAKGFGVVNEQERAVVLRFGVYQETKGPGLRWNPPLIDSVYPVNVTKVAEWTTNEQMLTKDLNIVDIKISVQFVINDAQAYVLNVRNPIGSLEQAANSALRHVAGSTLMHDVLTQGREQAAIDILGRLQTYLDVYQTGITVETVNIEDSNPPQQVQAAFDDVIKAREDEERYKNEAQTYANGIIPEARGFAQRTIEEATAYKEQVIAKADGEAQRFKYLLTEYQKAPEVTRQRLYLDAVQDVMSNTSKVMVDVEGGNNMMYIPLDKIMSSGSTSSARGLTNADIDMITNSVIERVSRQNSGSATTTRGAR